MQTRDQHELAKLFENLFRGGNHCYGIYDPDKNQ